MSGLTGVKFCTMVSTRLCFIMPVQNFGGIPQKSFRFKKHAKFGLISDHFEVRRRISSKRMNIFKIKFLFLYRDSFCIRRNKFGEVWSSDFEDLYVESYSLKVLFSENYISAFKGRCASKYLHALENDQVLLAHLLSGTAALFTTFSKGVKNWLKK